MELPPSRNSNRLDRSSSLGRTIGESTGWPGGENWICSRTGGGWSAARAASGASEATAIAPTTAVTRPGWNVRAKRICNVLLNHDSVIRQNKVRRIFVRSEVAQEVTSERVAPFNLRAA
jgi:hypothetical protein